MCVCVCVCVCLCVCVVCVCVCVCVFVLGETMRERVQNCEGFCYIHPSRAVCVRTRIPVPCNVLRVRMYVHDWVFVCDSPSFPCRWAEPVAHVPGFYHQYPQPERRSMDDPTRESLYVYHHYQKGITINIHTVYSRYVYAKGSNKGYVC